jgi:hypothetical protein
MRFLLHTSVQSKNTLTDGGLFFGELREATGTQAQSYQLAGTKGGDFCMDFNYFPDLNRYFKTLYYRNQEWFRYRNNLTQKEQQTLFRALLSMDDALQAVRGVFLQKEKGTAVNDA